MIFLVCLRNCLTACTNLVGNWLKDEFSIAKSCPRVFLYDHAGWTKISPFIISIMSTGTSVFRHIHEVVSHTVLDEFGLGRTVQIPVRFRIRLVPCKRSLKVMLHGTIFFVARKIDTCNMTVNLLQQCCKNLKPVQSCATRCGSNVALKIVCKRHVTRIDILCNNIALKIVAKNQF